MAIVVDLKDKLDAAAVAMDLDPTADKIMVLIGGVLKGMLPKDFEAGRITTGTPASAGATGTLGQIKWDSSFIYICVATDTWKRVAIATW